MAKSKTKAESALTSFTPVAILRSAIDAVPAMRYALGVGGLAAVVAIVLVGWKLEAPAAVFGTLIVLVFMVALVIFASLTGLGTGLLRPLALFLAWSFLVLMVAVAALFVSCAFFDAPKTLPCLLRNECPERAEATTSQKSPDTSVAGPTPAQPEAETAATVPTKEIGPTDIRLPAAKDAQPSPDPGEPDQKEIIVSGIITDAETETPITGARVNVDGYSEEAVITKTDGTFELATHAEGGQMFWLRVEKEGYSPKEVIHQAGSQDATIRLSKAQ